MKTLLQVAVFLTLASAAQAESIRCNKINIHDADKTAVVTTYTGMQEHKIALKDVVKIQYEVEKSYGYPVYSVKFLGADYRTVELVFQKEDSHLEINVLRAGSKVEAVLISGITHGGTRIKLLTASDCSHIQR